MHELRCSVYYRDCGATRPIYLSFMQRHTYNRILTGIYVLSNDSNLNLGGSTKMAEIN